jgi:hypothetical protein
MLRIEFKTGDWATGKSWRELEDNIRAREYWTFERRHDFRAEMRKRAFLANGIKMPVQLTSKQFILGLVKAGLFQIKEVTIATKQRYVPPLQSKDRPSQHDVVS